MIVFMIACVFTAAGVGCWVTAVVYTVARNQIIERQLRQLQYWQTRAMRAEDPWWRQP